MIRLFYLVSSIDSAKDISDDLHEHGVTDLPRFVERGAIIGFVLALAVLLPLAFLEMLSMPSAA